MTDYKSMTYDELVAANQDLMEKRATAMAEIENEQLAVNEAMDLRAMEQRVLGGMTDSERELMAEAIASMPATNGEAPVPEEGE